MSHGHLQVFSSKTVKPHVKGIFIYLGGNSYDWFLVDSMSACDCWMVACYCYYDQLGLVLIDIMMSCDWFGLVVIGSLYYD